jgi:hypothetical protein
MRMCHFVMGKTQSFTLLHRVKGWATKNLLSRAPPCFGRQFKPLFPAVFAVDSTHQSALDPRSGLWLVLLVGNLLGRPVPQRWGH